MLKQTATTYLHFPYTRSSGYIFSLHMQYSYTRVHVYYCFKKCTSLCVCGLVWQLPNEPQAYWLALLPTRAWSFYARFCAVAKIRPVWNCCHLFNNSERVVVQLSQHVFVSIRNVRCFFLLSFSSYIINLNSLKF